MTISEQGKDLAESFSFMEDWTEKYQYMIDLSKSLNEMDLNYKTDENLITPNLNETLKIEKIFSEFEYFSNF